MFKGVRGAVTANRGGRNAVLDPEHGDADKGHLLLETGDEDENKATP